LETAGTEQTFEKAARNWHDGKKACRIFFVFYSVIFMHKLHIIRQEYVIWLQILAAAILPNIIKKSVNI